MKYETSITENNIKIFYHSQKKDMLKFIILVEDWKNVYFSGFFVVLVHLIVIIKHWFLINNAIWNIIKI